MDLKKIMKKHKSKLILILSVAFCVLIIFLLYIFVIKGYITFHQMEDKLLTTAKDYYEEVKSELPKKNGDVSTVTLETLYKFNWLDALHIPGKKDLCSTNSWVKVIKEDDEYKYYTYLSCGKYQSKTDHEGPKMELNGDSTIVLDLNTPYQELGVKSVKDNKDKNISVNQVVIDTSKLDTSKVGSYEVTYTIEDKLKNKTTLTRIVQVNHYLRQEVVAKTDESNIFKGNIDNNYVWYSGFLWRIMYLSDNDIRLVTDEPVSTLMVGHLITDYMNSDMVKWLNDYFKKHLNDNENIIKRDNEWIVNKMDNVDEMQTINLDIGTITLNDYQNSFANNDTYMNQMSSYALLSYKLHEHYAYNQVNYIERQQANSYQRTSFEMKQYRDYTPMHVRPVIAIEKDSLVYSGEGTKDNPYQLTSMVNESKELNKHTSGEYVLFSNLLWRIVHVNENGTTRLVLNQNIFENGESKLIHYFDNNGNTKFNPSQEGNIGYYLNNDFIHRLNEDKIEYSEFDITNNNFHYGYEGLKKDYISAKIGTISLGEMFTTQPSYMPNPVWIMNGWKTPSVGFILNGYVAFSESNFNYYSKSKTVARPVINLKSDVQIVSGSGTSLDPYVVK